MQKITPFLWFNGKAEEAANFMSRFSRTQGLEERDGTETQGLDRRDP
jgi:predicted 3-demethylubiquinone-9 3-methyltransferase (glyoxalase superfamily)